MLIHSYNNNTQHCFITDTLITQTFNYIHINSQVITKDIPCGKLFFHRLSLIFTLTHKLFTYYSQFSTGYIYSLTLKHFDMTENSLSIRQCLWKTILGRGGAITWGWALTIIQYCVIMWSPRSLGIQAFTYINQTLIIH